MRILLAAVLAFLLHGAGAEAPIVLSLGFRPDPVRLSESVTVLITLTNQSTSPLYISRRVGDRLEIAVRDPAGTLVRGWPHILPPPPRPKGPGDLLRIDAKRSFRCSVEMRLSDLGITNPGRFSVDGGWHDLALAAPEIDENGLNFGYSHAKTAVLTVTKADMRPSIGLQPTAQTSEVTVAACTEAEAGR